MVSIPDMSRLNDISKDGRYIGQTVINWLNQEFIDQECHYKIGQSVEQSYISIREKGVTDPGELLMEIGTQLESFPNDFDKAFVGPWDVANKVSDTVFRLLDIEMCSCDITASVSTSDIIGTIQRNKLQTSHENKVKLTSEITVSTVTIEPELFEDIALESQSTFYRYNLLRRFLEAVPINKDEFRFPSEVGWDDIHSLIALCLGFRKIDLDNVENKNTDLFQIQQNQNLAPFRWKKLTGIPDFSTAAIAQLGTVEREKLDKKIVNDFPDDDASLDIVIEQFTGFEIYQLIKKSSCQEALARVLIVKWLYVHGVLQSDFPPTKERFIPAHMREDFE